MPIMANNNKDGDFEKTPLGNQQGVCAFVEDIGTHVSEYLGNEIIKHQIVVCWELKELMTEGDYEGKPFMISNFYTLSLSEKANLRKDLESWRGKAFTPDELEGFDVEKLIGANCLLNIIEHKKMDGSKFAKIASISPLIEGMEKLTVVNSDPPEWIDKKRQESMECKGTMNEDTVPEPEPLDETQDDLPF